MKAEQIFETVLYADDLAQAKWFYGKVIGLRPVTENEEFLAFQVGKGVLLIFDPRCSTQPGREIPCHGSRAPGHLAFAATAPELAEWEAHFAKHGIAIETKHRWDNGSHSLYLRDPAGNSIEFAPPNLWSS